MCACAVMLRFPCLIRASHRRCISFPGFISGTLYVLVLLQSAAAIVPLTVYLCKADMVDAWWCGGGRRKSCTYALGMRYHLSWPILRVSRIYNQQCQALG